MTDLIIAGFADTHTVFLARAALARLQEDEFGIKWNDVTIALWGADGHVAVQQVPGRSAEDREVAENWENLANLLFASRQFVDHSGKRTSGKDKTSGIDPTSADRIHSRFARCKSALLVRTRDTLQSEQVVSVLRGLRGTLAKLPLKTSSTERGNC